MPRLLHVTALAMANIVLFAAAVAIVTGLLWLAVATLRHHIRAAAARRAFHTAARETAGTDDGNELRHIDLSSVDLDAELLALIKKGESK